MAKRGRGARKGNNKFILGGRLIFGSDVEFLPITLTMIIGPIILFCVFVALHLRHVFLSYNAGYAVLVAAIIQTICVLVLLALTSARDPGIVPRNSHPPMEESRHESSSAEAGGRQTSGLQFPRTKDFEVNGITVKVKYCYTCMLYRPPRCSHCSTCDNCVERFDHHCPWVGQCIGLRNYRFYFLFISSMTLLCIYVFSMSAFYIKVVMEKEQCSVLKAITKSAASKVSVGLMAYTFLVLCFVGGLTGFHLYLISTNQTTSENRSNHRTANAFNHGCVGNFLEVFCTQLKPEETLRPAPTPSSQVEELGGDCCLNVEDDLDLGRDLQEISHYCNIEENIDEEMHQEGSRELEVEEGMTSTLKRVRM